MHRTVIEAGPGTVRRLCCGAAEADVAAAAAGLEWIDDPAALVDGQPVATRELWDALLASLACPDPAGSVLLIHPSWWSAARVRLIGDAARTRWDDVVTRPRAQLQADDAAVVVEIAAALVAITAADPVAEPRLGPPDRVAAAVARRVTATPGGTVLIDAPHGIPGAAALAAMITERLRTAGRRVEPAELRAPAEPPAPIENAPPRRPRYGAAVAALLVVVGLAAGSRTRSDSPGERPSTFLVEGRVALQVPADWPVRRVTDGPGSARVEVVSPGDPQLMLHVTQAVAPDASLAGAAETLGRAVRQANVPEPVFVDFNPAATSADRPAISYRELRDGRHIDWTVLVDGAVRIAIGCQHRPDDAAAIAAVCDRAVRSARALP